MAYNPKSYRKFIVAASSTALVAAAVAPTVSADVTEFSDVNEDTRHADQINYLLENSITEGYPDGTFKPESSMTRGEAAILVANALDLEAGNVDALPFNDLGEQSAGAVAALYEKGVTEGKSETEFGTNDQVTRAEMAAFIVRGFELSTDVTDQELPDGDYYNSLYDEVNSLVYHDYADGYPDGTFRGEEEITRGDFAYFLATTHQGETTPVETAVATKDTYFPTTNAEVNAFSAVNFLDNNGDVVAVDDMSQFSISDSKGYFSTDGSLSSDFETDGIPDDDANSTTTVTINDEDGNQLGQFDVEIVLGSNFKEIQKGAILNSDNNEVDYVTLDSSFTFDITQAVKYSGEVIGDDDGESISLTEFSDANISSSDNSVFVVNNEGVITPISKGTANLVVEWNDQTFQHEVEVKATPELDSLELNQDVDSITVKDDTETTNLADLDSFITAKDQHGEKIDLANINAELFSSDESVIKVTDGVITLADNVEDGATAELTVRSGDLVKVFPITVDTGIDTAAELHDSIESTTSTSASITLDGDIELDEPLQLSKGLTLDGNGHSLDQGVEITASDVQIEKLTADYMVINDSDVNNVTITESTATSNLATVAIGSNNLNQGGTITITNNTTEDGSIGLYPAEGLGVDDVTIEGNSIAVSSETEATEGIWLAFADDVSADAQSFADTLKANNTIDVTNLTNSVKIVSDYDGTASTVFPIDE
ncbi:hypothetical protein ABID56_002565 [Alkalibacillus flavidus]|uniref:SLH domain-containing protein n=1 Tax=Alkalibacillus flavidus TaxID=546021 RepID=A0ABV2KXV9_9BACI